MNLSDGLCKRCQGKNVENLQHLLFSCIESTKLWHVILASCQEYLGSSITLDKKLALTGLWQSGITTEMLITNMILSITRHQIWKIRCKTWYGGKTISTNHSLRILKNSLLDHIQILVSSSSSQADLIVHLNRLETTIKKIDVNSLHN